MIVNKLVAKTLICINSGVSLGAGVGLLLLGQHILLAVILLISAIFAWTAIVFREP